MINNKLKQICIDYLKDIQIWIDEGFPEHMLFQKDRSLCPRLHRYLDFKGEFSEVSHLLAGIYMTELYEEFIKSSNRTKNRNSTFPFNDEHTPWHKERYTGTFFENQDRLDFIKKYSMLEI